MNFQLSLSKNSISNELCDWCDILFSKTSILITSFRYKHNRRSFYDNFLDKISKNKKLSLQT